MKVKICFIDLETTGLDPKRNGIIQISGEICSLEGDHLTDLETFNFDVRPFDDDEVDDKALEVSGKTLLEIEEFEDPAMVYKHLTDMLGKYVDKFNSKDKMIFAGFNARFDMDFLREFFAKNLDKYFGSWFWFPPLDVMNEALSALLFKRADLPNFKLGTVARALEIKFEEEDLHDAMFDILLTKEIFIKTWRLWGKDSGADAILEDF